MLKILFGCLFLSLISFAGPSSIANAAQPATPSQGTEINRSYEQDVKPIFVQKCFDCHSDQVRYPSYYRWPIVKQLIDRDIARGREDLDLSGGFPFKSGKKSLSELLRSIREEIEEGDMPPFLYRLMHSGSAVTPEEKKTILNWLNQAEKSVR